MAATARAAGHQNIGPGEAAMTRHGIVQPPAAGARSSATNSCTSVMIGDADKVGYSRSPTQQFCAEAQRSSLPASSSVLIEYSRATPDISCKSKSP
jgi:hypothetical protein